jgi:hypothetical protein
MAYTLYAEGGKSLDWTELYRAVAPLRKRVELFPIPPDGTRGAGLGFSVPQRNLNELAWEEITQILDVLQKKFGMDVYAMNREEKITPATLEAVKSQFLGE